MDQSLRDAAQQGSIDALYELIQGDPNILDRIDEIPFVETPLHTVASAGHTQLAMEIMRLKPSFARKLNQDGFTPLHLALQKLHALENDQALQKKQTQLVYRLVSVDKDLVRVQGREGVTALHYVAQIGNLDLLSKFLEVCPTSIKDVTIRGETILHIALKYHHLRALKYLINWLHECTTIEDSEFWETRLLNWKDEEDNTVLHIAVSNNQPQVVRWLLNAGVHINHKNLGGLTALDILQGQMQFDAGVRTNRKNLWGFTSLDILKGQMQVDNNEMKDMLCRAGALSASSLPTVSVLRQQSKMTNELRSMLLVVVVLFITATYQAALSPPGGVWQDNYNPPTDQFNSTSPINVTSELSPTPHKAGKVTMDKKNYMLLFFANTFCFATAFTMIPLLLPFNTYSILCMLSMGFLYVSYAISLSVTNPFIWYKF